MQVLVEEIKLEDISMVYKPGEITDAKYSYISDLFNLPPDASSIGASMRLGKLRSQNKKAYLPRYFQQQDSSSAND